jgi:hypothetical protein
MFGGCQFGDARHAELFAQRHKSTVKVIGVSKEYALHPAGQWSGNLSGSHVDEDGDYELVPFSTLRLPPT